ncbi:unnamed protein product [Leptosia nina]|uniref:Phorbol-ester/DAG-type domain-containing protein n=1 Tax=Leptosia nina TaxID=320188 RepID=A0AAV1J077_9NEOP
MCGKFFAIAPDGVRCKDCNFHLHKNCPKAVSPSSKKCYKPCLIARSKSNRDYVGSNSSSIPHNDATTAGDIGSLALSSDVVASSFEELNQILSLRTIIIDFKSETYSQLTRAIASFTSRLDNMESRISKLEESVLQLGANNQL